MELKFKHFVALNALDVITTFIGLTYLHLTEMNPLANTMFHNLGLMEALISMKLVGLMVIYVVLSMYSLNIKKIALNIICFIFIIVVLNNSYQMIRVI
jgi:uncharacterized membrane protein